MSMTCETLAAIEQELLLSAAPEGYWRGWLSSSALSTAVGVLALVQVGTPEHEAIVRESLTWLCGTQNADGGWGDTVDSPSNLSTTLLCWSALGAGDSCADAHPCKHAQAAAWLEARIGNLEPGAIAAAVTSVYGNDRTFAAPILAACALAGRLGPSSTAWQYVPALPFELAALPHAWFRWARLPVVSYALPALIAIGLVRHVHARRSWSPARVLRSSLVSRVLRKLQAVQPINGGFLEAPPLTAFVCMSLAACGLRKHAVTARCVEFLLASRRSDGSWPIDSDLAVWVTTLCVNALSDEGGSAVFSETRRRQIADWLLAHQHRDVHPFTHAAPGGWGWTDLPGCVPDADDTAGALLALRNLHATGDKALPAVTAGVKWLLGLQNCDGGIPTFCRGWGRLPFDSSCPDITAHTLRAFNAWLPDLSDGLRAKVEAAVRRGLVYLRKTQSPDGCWTPLWFGNQQAPRQENPVHGTAQVAIALFALPDAAATADLLMSACRWLAAVQNPDGGWGGNAGVPSSVEETALAVAALTPWRSMEASAAVSRGIAYLLARFTADQPPAAAPLGLYFASLWYSERLYPLIFTAAALRGAIACTCHHHRGYNPSSPRPDMGLATLD